MVLYVWRKSAPGFVVCVRNIIPLHRPFAGYHTNSRHFQRPLSASDLVIHAQPGFPVEANLTT